MDLINTSISLTDMAKDKEFEYAGWPWCNSKKEDPYIINLDMKVDVFIYHFYL